MKILCTGQVESVDFIMKQVRKQTVQPDHIEFLVDSTPAVGINARRLRIAENHENLKGIVGEHQPDLVWQVEQDAILPENTLETLLENYKQLESHTLGYVSGVQVGRHGIYALGAYKVGKDEFSSIDHKKTGLHQIDGGGFYCLLASANSWLAGQASWNGEPWGPDVNWGLSLRKLGYHLYVNMDLHIGHKTQRGEIWPTHASTCNVRFVKKDDTWTYKTS